MPFIRDFQNKNIKKNKHPFLYDLTDLIIIPLLCLFHCLIIIITYVYIRIIMHYFTLTTVFLYHTKFDRSITLTLDSSL